MAIDAKEDEIQMPKPMEIIMLRCKQGLQKKTKTKTRPNIHHTKVTKDQN